MNTTVFTRHNDGTVSWDSKPGDQYLVISHNPRKRMVYDEWKWANGINLRNGNKYLLRDGKRYLIQSVVN